MPIDPDRFPRATRYLAALPAGLDAFPDCTVRTDAIDPYWKDHGAAVMKGGLDGTMGEFFSGRLTRSGWTREVVFQTGILMLRDAIFATDEEHFKWVRGSSSRVFSRPFFRAMMAVLSPTFVVMGAGKRWTNLHRGSTLVTAQVRGDSPASVSHKGELSFPEGLFSSLYLKGLEQPYEVSLESARAKNPRVQLTKTTPGKAFFDITWDA